MECEDDELTPSQMGFYQASTEAKNFQDGELDTINVANNKMTPISHQSSGSNNGNHPKLPKEKYRIRVESSPPNTTPPEKTNFDVDRFYASIEGDTKYKPNIKPQSYNCSECGEVNAGNVWLMLHLDSHLQETRKVNLSKGLWVHCEHCTLKFNSPDAMMAHMAKFHGGPNMCRICELGFESKKALYFHLQDSHPPIQMPYCCPLCQFRSSVRENLMRHFGNEHNKEPYLLCPYCLLLFRKSSVFMDHLTKHQNKDNCHQCKLCQLAFLTLSKLWAHSSSQHKSWVPSSVPCKNPSQPVAIAGWKAPKNTTSANKRPSVTSSKKSKSVAATAVANHKSVVAPTATTATAAASSKSFASTATSSKSVATTANASRKSAASTATSFAAATINRSSPATTSSSPPALTILYPPATANTPSSTTVIAGISQPPGFGQAITQTKRQTTKRKEPNEWWSRLKGQNHACCECGAKITSAHHFKPLPLGCPKCPYVTFCPSSFPNHVIEFHFSPVSQEITSLHRVAKVRREAAEGTVLSCKECGNFETTHGSTMANHVITCPKKNAKNKERFRIHPLKIGL